MPIIAISLAVVGGQYPNADKKAPTRLFAIGLCRPGDPVQLVPEPGNKKDDLAIMVLNREGMQMGYVPAEKAPLLHKRWRDGHDTIAIFQAATEHGAMIRVSFDGEVPALPPQREAAALADSAEADPDWFPDEIYPDE